VIRKIIKWTFQIVVKSMREVALDIKEGADMVMVKLVCHI
jgi:delta-aminolevulinic acid dehydratase/porphobilinogen synthase